MKICQSNRMCRRAFLRHSFPGFVPKFFAAILMAVKCCFFFGFRRNHSIDLYVSTPCNL